MIEKNSWIKKHSLLWANKRIPKKSVFSDLSKTYGGPLIKYSKWEVYNNASEARLHWKEIKMIIKNNIHDYDLKMYKESDKGKVLKRYKTEWYVDYQYLLNNSQNIRIIRQLRIGCSQLTAHSPYHFKNPSVCPGCNMTVEEDNYHFILKCKRYNDVRTEMINKLQHIFKLQKLKLNTKTLLGFPKSTLDLKKGIFYYYKRNNMVSSWKIY